MVEVVLVARPKSSNRLRDIWQTTQADQARDRRFAGFLQEVLAGCGLSQVDFSVGGGRILHIPQVISVSDGPPVTVNVHLLPGQTPDDFADRAEAIAENLGVAEVRVVPLGPFLIRLELLGVRDTQEAPNETNGENSV
jgi:hypothetical protein